MIHQIRKLKITLYERELEKQKIEMDYLKMQIRRILFELPELYLQHDRLCDYEHARAMTKSLRIIFHIFFGIQRTEFRF
ncbi:hypothetical protein [Roseburia intestinalis]|uniref:Uncharacterized protein n=1 Tax=Roseburia intestinalis L1-82 TaxID=536231 RepID=A0AAQ2Z911_9FIRM|nr:hypothetical protein [Roseburia intestinalis]VCV23872.1 hypothetical protein RIL182_03791 [Roseburia intestinalis L1-82]